MNPTCPTCNHPIESQPAKPCLDALFCTEVMKWFLDRSNYIYWKDKKCTVFARFRHEFNSSTNIIHAMEGVEKHKKKYKKYLRHQSIRQKTLLNFDGKRVPRCPKCLQTMRIIGYRRSKPPPFEKIGERIPDWHNKKLVTAM